MDLRLCKGHFFGQPPSLNYRFLVPDEFEEISKHCIPRLRRDPERRQRVLKEIQKFVDTGVAVEIDSIDDDATATKPRWYLPLHIVE